MVLIRIRRSGIVLLAAAVLLLAGGGGTAGALAVRETSPAAQAVIEGRHAEYVIHFDGPVDHQHARLEITQGGRVVQTLHALGDSAPNVLFASSAAPPPGAYILHWEARSPGGGETASGDIPFSVR